MQETWVWSLGWEDLLKKEAQTHSNILAREIPWTEEPGRLQFMGHKRVRHKWADIQEYNPCLTSTSSNYNLLYTTQVTVALGVLALITFLIL